MSSIEPDSGSTGVTGVAVAVVKRGSAKWIIGLIGVPALVLIAVLFAIAALSVAALAELPGGDNAASTYAARIIPANMLALYQSPTVKQECPGLSWTIVAAIVHLESMDGRNPGISPAGAMGPSQFIPTTWDAKGRTVVRFTDSQNKVQPFGRVPDGQGYALDGDGDGIADIMNAKDSVPATARFLCANGGGNQATLYQAIHAYNHAWWYVFGGVADSGSLFEGVVPLAQKLSANGTISNTSVGNGEVLFALGANLPGLPVTPETIGFLQVVAGHYGKPITCTTGTNHSYLTVDGNVSDHASGHACDFGMAANSGTDDGPVGDALATACLIAAGDPPDVASTEASIGGLYTREHSGLRIQCIWKTDEGGNHHNHVHVGASPG